MSLLISLFYSISVKIIYMLNQEKIIINSCQTCRTPIYQGEPIYTSSKGQSSGYVKGVYGGKSFGDSGYSAGAGRCRSSCLPRPAASSAQDRGRAGSRPALRPVDRRAARRSSARRIATVRSPMTRPRDRASRSARENPMRP